MTMTADNRYALLIIDVEEKYTVKKHRNTSKKISVVADDLRQQGIPVFWITYPVINWRSSFNSIFIAKPDREKDKTFAKNDFSAFASRFPENLEAQTNHLIICGYSVSVCVLETIKDALEQGYQVTLLADCTNYHYIDYSNQKITFKRKPLDRLIFGKDFLSDLLRKHPDQFTIKTHMELLMHLETNARTKGIRDIFFREQTRPWTFECV